MLYSALRPLLFALPPETAHRITLNALDTAAAAGLSSIYAPKPAQTLPISVMGLDFPNRVGLAAGLDKNGEHIDGLASLGFGFIEVGTVTPRPQPGNRQPRLFRLPEAGAIINRMGFNNEGVDALVANVAKSRWQGILGINIGKNFDTPLERAADDYVACLKKVFPVASYVAINISSPNTAGLRNLQQGDELDRLLEILMKERHALASGHARRVPLAVKLAPDLDDAALEQIASQLLAHGVDGVVATNTTTARDGVAGLQWADETGGLSGGPLGKRSTHAIAVLAAKLGGRIPIIGVGGIVNAAAAREKLDAGASVIQIYTGLIYRGPGLIGEILREVAAC